MLPLESEVWTSTDCHVVRRLVCLWPAVARPRRTLPPGRAGLADVSNVGRGRSRSGSKKLHANSKNWEMVRIPSSNLSHMSSIFLSTFRALTGLFFPNAKAFFSAIKSSSLSVFDLIRASN